MTPTGTTARRGGAATDPLWFREVLGQYPTGVCAITAMGSDGKPAGLSVGSFTSVSLDPPLVAFMPDKRSSSWPKIREAGVFCVNMLGADQEYVCRAFAVKGGDKFAGITWQLTSTGSPVIDGVVAWIDCELEAVHDAGDHEIVIGRVRELDIASSGLPLLFFQGGYGRFAPASLAVRDADLVAQLRYVDLARPHMERLAAGIGGECIANAISGAEVVIVASAGQRADARPTRVGQRLPWIPPWGLPFVAWARDPDAATRQWTARLGPGVDPARAEALRAKVQLARKRGYSVRLQSERHDTLDRTLAGAKDGVDLGPDSFTLAQALEPTYEPADPASAGPSGIRAVAVAVLSPGGDPMLVLNLVGIGDPRRVEACAAELQNIAAEITAAVGD